MQLERARRFEREHSNGEINLKIFAEFEEIYDVAKYLWLTGLLEGMELRSDTTHSVGALYDKAVPLRNITLRSSRCVNSSSFKERRHRRQLLFRKCRTF